MRAAIFTETGPASVLRVVDRSRPAVGADEVRVRIVVSGVNPTDVDVRSGRFRSDDATGPHVPGQDGAGVVDAVGDAVSGLVPGDRVWVWDAAWQRPEGTGQEYVTLPRRQVVPLPDGAGFDLGASVGIPALTAHRALTAAADGPHRLAPGALEGRSVLVVGGAGAVGHAAIQLARWSGATVMTTVGSAEKAVLARRAGADHVVNYREEDVVARVHDILGHGVDLIVEVDAAGNLDQDADILAPHGTISIYTPGHGPTVPAPAARLMFKNAQLQFILTYSTTVRQKDAAIGAVSDAMAAGALRIGDEAGLPVVRFPLDRIAEAHLAVEKHVVGKVLVDVSAP